jgi:hypothetical protein
VRTISAIRGFYSGERCEREFLKDLPQPLRHFDANYPLKSMNKGDSMGAIQQTHTKSRKSKFRRKPQRSTKPLEAWRPQVLPDDESTESEEIDRLLLSSLRYWEVERDLIEERLAAKSR